MEEREGKREGRKEDRKKRGKKTGSQRQERQVIYKIEKEGNNY